MIDDCTAIILAGGDSRRMGSDKAAVMLGECTLLESVTKTMQLVFPKVCLSLRQARPDLALPQIVDEFADVGPLAGLCAALEQATTPWIFAVATDMPFVQAALIEQLALRRPGYQAVVPVVGGHPQPLAAFYASSCLEPIRALLAGGGKSSLRAALEQLRVCRVDEAELMAVDPELRSFFDLDTPEDLAAARRAGWGQQG